MGRKFSLMILALLVLAGQAQAVELTVNVTGDAEPGGTVTLTAEVDEGTINSISWSQVGGVEAAISSPTGNPSTDVTLGAAGDYTEELIHFLSEPEGGGGLQDRFQVVGINPFAIEEAGLVIIQVSATTTAGAAEAEVEIETHLPFKPTAGIRNVATGLTVLLHRKDEATCTWSLTGPSGSLSDTSAQSPYFTPTVAGTYEATCGDDSLEIYVGDWTGVITGQDEDGRPEAENCSMCHSGVIAEWAQTGHAEIFANSLNTNNHYSENCFSCHTVGYDPDVDNNGIDEAADYEGFIDNILHNPEDPENWNNTLLLYPDVAQLGNIQCENCHGPQGGTHVNGEARISISSDACATCHGEPLRHARFQQWQLSGHGNFELAIEEGERGGCAKCHTGNGFIAWEDLGFAPDEDPDADWTVDEIQPQTCVTCHDPHDIGTTSGDPNNAQVRVQGDTPVLMSGFMASDVGRGAICMVCHNARRGLRNDDQPAPSDPERAPHRGPQSDVLLGQNVYFLDLGDQGEADYPPGLPGGHAKLEDSCATCHMEATPPPPELANNGGGTNHLFNSNQQVCGVCHVFEDGEALAESLAVNMEALETLIEESWYDVIEQVTAPPAKGEKRAERFVDLDGEAIISYLNIGDIDKVIFTERSGRQALTFIMMDATEIGPLRLGDIDVIEGVTVCQKGTKTKQLKKAKQIDKTLAKGAEVGSCEDGDQAVVLGTIVDFASPTITKAGWNLLVVEADGSHGVHNPSFANAAIGSAISALADETARVQILP